MTGQQKNPRDLFDVAGKSILLIGATGAYGRVGALALGAAGAHLTLAAGGSEALEKVGEEVSALGARATTVNLRPDTPANAEALVAAAVGAHGGLDGLVLASGVNIVSPVTETDYENFKQVMEANVDGAWLICQAAGRRFIEQGRGGKVALISSTRGKLGHPGGYVAYCTSKSAVDGLTRTLGCEWGRHGVNVNAIAPTVFRSDLTGWMFDEEGRGKEVREGMLARIPLGRLGEPDDLVGALIFLLSPASDFMTGQTMYVDGGYTAG
ncbi:MAG: SDR family oxidoreductase [bacterium]